MENGFITTRTFKLFKNCIIESILQRRNFSGSIISMKEQALLVIDDALDNIDEGQLLGERYQMIFNTKVLNGSSSILIKMPVLINSSNNSL